MSAEKALENLEKNEGVVKPNSKKTKEPAKEIQTRPVTLLFTIEEAKEYISIAEGLYKKFKVDNVTDLSMAVIKQAKELK